MKKLMLAVAVVAAGLVAVALSPGSSHREAPNTIVDPTGDETDVYAFTAKEAPNALTVIANWIPLEDPAGGPNFYKFDDKARYYINIDNTGDGVQDIRYRFQFKTTVRNKNSFLYGLPGVKSFDDPKLNVVQTYDVTREERGGGSRSVGKDLPVAPNNVGPKTIPDYHSVVAPLVKRLKNGGKVFAGQRDDPFFIDLGTVFDALNIRKGTGNEGAGKDDIAGYNTHAIALQLPEEQVTRNGRAVKSAKSKNAVVGVWASTERQQLQVTGSDEPGGGGFQQVSRLGNPLVNEVVIPLGKKDQFNRTKPQDDAKNYGKFVLEPELAKVLNQLFMVKAPEKDRTDVVQAILQGIPDLNQVQGKGEKEPAVDTIKLNLGVPPNDKPSRFGVIGGDNSGFPNGRRLGDDILDIEVRVIAGFLKGNMVPLGDGVDFNDVPFHPTFPYAGSPKAGFDSQLKREEPAHDPTAADLK